MSAKMSRALVVMLKLALTLAGWGGADAQRPGAGAPAGPRRERSGASAAPTGPNISFIDSFAPTCYRPELQSNTCFVNWGSMRVSTASPHTIVSMTLTIDGHMRAYYRGYFQSTIHISPTVHGDGFRVACGPSGVDGVTGVGHVYDWILSARDSEGLETTSEGAVTCPALDPIHLRKTSEGPLGVGTTYQSLGRL